MSIIREDLVQEAAAAAGVKHVGEKVASSLAADAEYRLREIIQDALNFKRHSRRRKLTPADINNALRVRNVEPLYGFTFPEPIVYTTKQGEGGATQVVIEEKELEFDELLSAPLPKAPVEVTLRAHWLAIDGVQPLIPENPIPENLDVAAAGKKRKAKDSEAGEKDPMVQDVLSQELQLYYENVTSAVVQGSPHILRAALSSLRRDPGLQALLPYFARFITEEVTRSLKDLPTLNALLSMTLAILSNAQLHVEPRLHELMPAVMTCMVGKQLCKSSLEPHWNLRDRAAKLLNFIVDRYAAPYSSLQQRITNTLLHAFLEPTKPLTTHYGAIAGLAALGPQTMNQLIVPNASAYASLLQKYTFDVNRRDESVPVTIGIIRRRPGSDGEDGMQVDGQESDMVVERSTSNHVEKFVEQNHIKRFEAIRVRGALLDAVGKCIFWQWKGRLVKPTNLNAGSLSEAPQEAEGSSAKSKAGAYEDLYATFGDKLSPFYADMSQPICMNFI